MRNWLILLICVVLLASLAAAGYAYFPRRTGPKFLTATVSRGRVETVVNSTGTVKAVDSVSVGSFVSGPLAEVRVTFNSHVAKDEVLAVIDDKLFKAVADRDTANLDTQKALLDTQLAYLENQKSELVRVTALFKQAEKKNHRAEDLERKNKGKGYVSGVELDDLFFTRQASAAQVKLAEAMVRQAEASVRQAQASVRQAAATLRNSLDNLGYTVIKSPVTGIVVEKKVEKGQTVASQFQTPELFVIAADLDRAVDVHASVDEADIGMIRQAQQRGQPVTFTVDAYLGELFPGQIKEVRMSSTTVQNVVTYPVVIRAPNPPMTPGKKPNSLSMKLLPGMTANITFHIEAKENVLRVPAAALRFLPALAQVREQDRHYLDVSAASTTMPKRTAEESAGSAKKRRERHVWVEDGNLLRAVPVTLGLIDRQFAEVTAGDVQDGQAIVTGFETTR